ncbi:MAG: hypothetical protein K0S16_1948 [Moraxellaceae bacterium]|jgi:hypothetical protein|nr:hypothetical protein [Moraxellaceae bacterium]
MARQLKLPGLGPAPQDIATAVLLQRLPPDARQVYLEAYRRAQRLHARAEHPAETAATAFGNGKDGLRLRPFAAGGLPPWQAGAVRAGVPRRNGGERGSP